MTLEPGARPGRYGVCDVHYPDAGGAVAALVVAGDAELSTVLSEHVAFLAHVAPYEPGAFFERELPALRAVLAGVDALDLLVVDGYVDLDPEGRPGLGAHVHAELGVPVVGVAKTPFRAATHAIEVRRGSATRPLYVTAAGMPAPRAAALVAAMAGPHRIPAALRRVDALARRPELAQVAPATGGPEPGDAPDGPFVRPAEPRDLAAVTGLVRELATSFVPEENRVAEGFADLLASTGAGGAHGRLTVAEEAGRVVGYCLAASHTTLHANGPAVWVEELCVDAARRGSGIGSALMADVEAWAARRGAVVVALATRRAGGFYAGLGYEESAAYLRKVL